MVTEFPCALKDHDKSKEKQSTLCIYQGCPARLVSLQMECTYLKEWFFEFFKMAHSESRCAILKEFQKVV